MKAMELYNKFKKGEIVYLFDDFEDAAFRLVPQKDHSIVAYCRRRGKPEYMIAVDSDLVTEAQLSGRVITEADYQGN